MMTTKRHITTQACGVHFTPFRSYRSAINAIGKYLNSKSYGYVCVAAAHLVVECNKDNALREGVNNALAVTADGMPTVWLLRALGHLHASRIYGPTLMRECFVFAKNKRIPIFLLGGRKNLSKSVAEEAQRIYKNIVIAGCFDIPHRPISRGVFEEAILRIQKSKARIVFVGLGCPWQEHFMIGANGKTNAIYIGVGGAFDMFTGRVKQAPTWIQNSGFEWAFRLIQEPKRLLYRYTITHSMYVIIVLRFLLQKTFKKISYVFMNLRK